MSFKIAEVICPVEFGGGENQILLRAIKLKEKEINVVVFCLSKSETFENLLKQYNIKYYTICNRKLGFSPSFTEYLLHTIFVIFSSIRNIELFTDFDIVNAHSFPSILIPFIFKKFFRRRFKSKIIYTHHHYPRSKIFMIFKKLFSIILKDYDSIIAVSSKVMKYSLIDIFPEMESKIYLIPNGIDERDFQITIEKNFLRKYLGLSNDDIYAIYPARFAPHKNHNFLLKVLNEIKVENFKLILTSSGSTEDVFKKEIYRLGLEKRIIMLGNISHDKLIYYLMASDFCVFPSLAEGFGVAILEAMMAGLPVIIFKGIYMDEHGKDILVANTEEEFIELVKFLIENENERLDLSRKMKGHALKFTISEATNKYISLCKKLTII
jgi:glycosyltransferase involved in cell wall biosynthesis